MTARPAPLGGRILTLPYRFLLAVIALGVAMMAWRFVAGLGATTGLNDGYPWGIWIAFDVVTGTALACGGYAVAILCYVLNRGQYHPLVRPAILTSALGYTVAGVGIVLDVGRYWLLYGVFIPSRWNLNSVLLEVALCVTAYIFVLWIELSPAFLERWAAHGEEGYKRLMRAVHRRLDRALLFILALGLLLPTMHQSSLGSLLIVAETKLHGFWHTPMLPLLFLVSCLAMGYAVVMFESLVATLVFKRPSELPMLGQMARVMMGVQVAYLVLRFFDLSLSGKLGMLAADRPTALLALEALVLVLALAVLVHQLRHDRGREELGQKEFYRREGLAVVGLSWTVAGLIGSLPFLFSGAIPGFVDAFFESVSGFTTTGSTILSPEGIDGMSRAIAFWRSFTHWLGGIGIVLVFVVLFPAGGRSLFRSEVPGVSREAVRQRVRDSGMGLMRVYVGLTAVQIVLYLVAGLDLYDASVHAFGTLATGGFSTHSASMAHFDSVPVEAITIVFMFLAGINFAVYDTTLRLGPKRGWAMAWRSSEARLYTGVIVGSALLIGLVLWFWGGSNGVTAGAPGSELPDYSSLGQSMRDASFVVVSVQTSTGYGTADYDLWPQFCRVLLMGLAFVGACAGSTGGGLKMVRFMVLAKASLRSFASFARPRAKLFVRMNGQPLDEGLVSSIIGYFGMWFLIAGTATLCMSAMDIEPVTAATSVLATLNNIGPGLAMVGPTESFGWMPDLGKLLCSVLMLIGRLEFYAVVVLFLPRFWRI